jgi:hypothetical protein
MERGIKMRLLLRRINYLFRYLALSFLCLFFLLPADCEELEELVPPCFTGSELDKIREWEKSWVGKKLNFAKLLFFLNKSSTKTDYLIRLNQCK